MARQEADREDLMGEATAYRRRIEFSLPDHSERTVAGFRSTGAFSIYFGADPIYQFDPQQRLRRAYVDGLLYRTQGSTLAQLERQRTDSETILQRQDLSATELQTFLMQVAENLCVVQRALDANLLKVHQQVPADVEMLSSISKTLQHLLNKEIELAPAIAGKK